ncbi:hypothetical protein L1049_012676 [Liquidambar formosana]|uniref:PRP28/DDX23-like helical domain-containing protein n=1 Tax=Liquidambar formosana TaxID=63359 RepID=A0AAP0N839_LIQFO
MKRSCGATATAGAKKPVFLTKAERQHRDEIEKSSSGSSSKSCYCPSLICSSERRNRKREREIEEAKALEKLARRKQEIVLEAIKEHYFGSKKPRKRVIKSSDKFRFSFDWDNTEDTLRDMNSLYQSPHEARLLFGRGFPAWIAGSRRGSRRRARKR